MFVIMPDHFHGIICLYKEDGKETSEAFGRPVAGSLSTIIRSFKSSVTRRFHLLPGHLGQAFWQRNYFEHVIRNEKDLRRIEKYIFDNPYVWELKNYSRDDLW